MVNATLNAGAPQESAVFALIVTVAAVRGLWLTRATASSARADPRSATMRSGEARPVERHTRWRFASPRFAGGSVATAEVADQVAASPLLLERSLTRAAKIG